MCRVTNPTPATQPSVRTPPCRPVGSAELPATYRGQIHGFSLPACAFFFRFALASVVAAVGLPMLPAQQVRDTAVEITATHSPGSPDITLHWPSTPYPLVRQELHARDTIGQGPWQAVGTPLPLSSTQFLDTTTRPGAAREYRLVRHFSNEPHYAVGYLVAGSRVPVNPDRGRLVLAVDASLATPLAPEILRLTEDLTGDGWEVQRLDIPANQPASALRDQIIAARTADPLRTRAVFLLGPLAVPYSGATAADGHDTHVGAWPADGYFGDMDGIWPDTTVTATDSVNPKNHNLPGDGKFDPSYLDLARSPELAVGRVDFSGLPASPFTHVELTRRYLDRNHAWRHQSGPYAQIPRRAFIDDRFGNFYGESFAGMAWRGFSSIVGPSQLTEGSWLATIPTQPHLLAYGCGPGSMDAIGNVANSADFFSTPNQSVFQFFFGSFFGDWDGTNNVLKASLAGPDGSLALSSTWAGRPHWPLHLLGSGSTLGDCLLAASRNPGRAADGYLSGMHARGAHLALLGDPSLHLWPQASPTNASATSMPGAIQLSWSPPPGGPVDGYILCRASPPDAAFVRLTDGLLTGTSFTDRTAIPGQAALYRIRAVRVVDHPGGSLLVPGQGIFAGASAGPPSSSPDLRVIGNGLPLIQNDPAPSPDRNTKFTTSGRKSFTLRNQGSSDLIFLAAPTPSGPGASAFVVTGFPSSPIPPGDSATFDVDFSPANPSPHSASITLASNDPNQNPFSIALEGHPESEAGELSVLPAVPAFSLTPGNTTTGTILLENHGTSPVSFTAGDPFASFRGTDSTQPASPSIPWSDIRPTGTQLTFPDPDESFSSPILLGFPFAFNGASQTEFRVCTNGYIDFGMTYPCTVAAVPLPNPAAPPDIIAGFWHDLNLSPSGTVHVLSSSNECIIQWTDAASYLDPSRKVTFQIILKPDGSLHVLHHHVGIQSGEPVTGAQASGLGIQSSSPPQAGLTTTFFSPGFGNWVAASPSSGTISAGDSLALQLLVNSTSVAAGLHQCLLPVMIHGAAEPLHIPLGLHVGSNPGPRAAWLHAAFFPTTTGAHTLGNSDPDHDGFSNLLEYALGSDPLSPRSSPRIILSPDAFKFRRIAGLTDLTLTVQSSSSLGNWNEAAKSTSGGPMLPLGLDVLADDGPTPIKDVTILPPPPPAFFRLHIRSAEN